MSSAMDSAQCLALIDQEIAWCKTHKGESAESHDFEKGFIKGLEQARTLIVQGEKTIKQDLDESLRRFIGA